MENNVIENTEFSKNEAEIHQENLQIDEEISQEELELKQLEEELGAKEQDTETHNAVKPKDMSSPPQATCENTDVKAKLERLKLLRQKKKERKRARKLQEKPEDQDLKQILTELESSFDGKEFQVLIRVLQPPIKVLKERYYEIRNDLTMALTRYYPQVDIKLFGSCVTDLIFDSKS